ncbi:hypothetical protein B0H16DRAFT_340757 [Mycena metata]|uniref:Uncharacterized protein n=1 Tax=Mycena metata TaxID=1033252 RepID=A0AAD7HLQ8_9AGAR|nr:hypothetical protein B0H16DRAFT_340757 [Mycena metata]
MTSPSYFPPASARRRPPRTNSPPAPTADFPSEPLATRIMASGPQNQLQSPLFTSLYPELRHMVFKHALTEYHDHTRPYNQHEFYYRPDFEFAGRIDTNLLLTCRLIYLETHLAPIYLNQHVFWMYRAPPGRLVSSPETYFERMTLEQRGAVREVRFFAQMFWLEGRGPQVWAAGLTVRKLVITIRHSDWWYWEDGEDLRMNDPTQGWDAWVRSLPGLEEIQLELETLDAKREQLEERVQVARGWTFPTQTGGRLVHDGEEPRKSTWFGSVYMSPRYAGDAGEFDYDMGWCGADFDYSDDEEINNNVASDGPEVPIVGEATPSQAIYVPAESAENREGEGETGDQHGGLAAIEGHTDEEVASPMNLKLHVMKLRFVEDG